MCLDNYTAPGVNIDQKSGKSQSCVRPDSIDFVQSERIIGSIIESGGARALVRGDFLTVFPPAAVVQVDAKSRVRVDASGRTLLPRQADFLFGRGLWGLGGDGLTRANPIDAF
jgi:hypothetical protein